MEEGKKKYKRIVRSIPDVMLNQYFVNRIELYYALVITIVR